MAEKEDGGEGSQDTQGSEEYEVELEVPEWLTDFFNDPYNLVFLVVLLVATYFRVINLDITSIWPDTANHLWLVRNYLSSDMMAEVAYQGSFLFITLVKILSFFFSPFMAGKLTSVIYSLAGITAMYFLGRELVNKETGLVAALVLAFVPIFWFQSTRPLLDTNITSMVVIVLLCLVKYERTHKKAWAVSLGVAMLAAVMTKLIGVFVFFAIGAYYLLVYRLKLIEMLKEREDFRILAGAVIAAGIILMLFNYVSAGVITGRSGGKIAEMSAANQSGGSGGSPFHFFFFKQIPNMISWIGTLLLLIGIYVTFKRFKKGEKVWAGLYLMIAPWFVFFSQHSFKSPRYILPTIPVLLLIAFVGVPKIFGKFRWEVVAVGVLILLFIYPAGASLIQNKSASYTGYQEAGTYIRQNMGENDLVIAGAKRQTRLFTESPYVNQGGQVINNRWNRSEFLRKLQEFDRKYDRIWLLVDRWEYTQPDWAHPLNRKKLKWVQEVGFKPVKVVKRNVPTRRGMQEAPVAWIFVYAGTDTGEETGSN